MSNFEASPVDVLVDAYQRLPDRILPCVEAAVFEKQFRSVFTSRAAMEASHLVYAWIAERPIPRLRGSSKIVYIGKTDYSLSNRHARYAALEAKWKNWDRYEHILKEFGAVTVHFALVPRVEDPRVHERRLLEEYMRAHLEVPPLNRSTT